MFWAQLHPIVMAGLDPGIHDLTLSRQRRRGWPGQARHDEVMELRAKSSHSVPVLQPADVLLGVEFEPDALDQVKLGLEEIDVMFLILHQLFEQVA